MNYDRLKIFVSYLTNAITIVEPRYSVNLTHVKGMHIEFRIINKNFQYGYENENGFPKV